MDYLDDLESDCPDICTPVVDLLRSFKPIVDGTFGHTLDEDYQEKIQMFRERFLDAQIKMETLNPTIKLNISWKIHAIVKHLPQFLSRVNCGMALYSEQCAESSHHAMKATLSRFSVGEEHPDHGQRLLRAVVEFSSQRI